ncbi:MAG: DeoR family transcriptional regulator [Methanoregula sp.]|nr:DeoR family transcriptional regulator [Methanoregula sp.]
MERVTLPELFSSHASVLRNKGIAQVLYDIGWIERWGSGIQKIRSASAEAGLPEPLFQEDQGFSVTFRKDVFSAEYLTQMELNERQLQAIPYLRKQGSISKREYQDLVSVSTRTALYDLTALVNKGVLVRIGTGKSSRYSLSSKPKNVRSGNS